MGHVEEITFRPLELSDSQAYRDMMADPDIVKFAATVPVNPSLGWATERIQDRNQSNDSRGPKEFGLFLLKDDHQRLVGNALWFDASDGNTEIGYAIHADYRGKGLAQKALQLILRHVRKTIGYKGRIYAGVAKDNPASMHILEKANFVKGWDWESQSIGRGSSVQLWVYYFD